MVDMSEPYQPLQPCQTCARLAGMTTDDIRQALAAAPPWVWTLVWVVVPAALLASVVILITRRRSAANANADPMEREQQRADRLTYLAALIGTAAMAEGMWRFFGDVLHVDAEWLRMALFAFFEIATVVSGIRAKVTLRRSAALAEANPDAGIHVSAGADGRAVYVLAALSGVLAASHEQTVSGAVARLLIAAAAAWLWHRGLAVLKSRLTGRPAKKRNWAITPDLILARLGLIEGTGRQVSDVVRARRVGRLSTAAYRLWSLRQTGGSPRAERRAARVLRRWVLATAGHIAIPADTTDIDVVRTHLAGLYGVEQGTAPTALADLDPWRLTDKPADTGERPDTDDDTRDTATDDADPAEETAGGAGSGVVLTSEQAKLIARAVKLIHPDMPADMIAPLVGRSARQTQRYLDVPPLVPINGRQLELTGS